MNYFSMSSLSKDPKGLAGTIKVRKDPRKILNGILGTLTDVDGRKWDLRGQVGEYVLARPYQDDYWTSTLPNDCFSGLQSATWRSYAIEVIDSNSGS